MKDILAVAACSALPRAARADFPPQAEIDTDPLRPRYHLMPRRGWMNDPCAPVFYQGRYHLFFQYNPGASVWGDMHWAHAVSDDMVRWRERPVALAPTPGAPDAFGVFTGSMVIDHGTPTILYTCVSPSSAAQATLAGSQPPEREAQCLATPASPQASGPDAALDRWNKLPNPVIAAPPAGMHVTGFRDPVPWREADGNYYMLLASGEMDKGGRVLLYKSADLRAWSFEHVFAQGKPNGQHAPDPVDTGEMWECPDFFPLGDRHVLIHSTGTAAGRATVWQAGRLDHATMLWTPEHEGVLNHGPYYAPKTQTDAAGRRILWGWIPETRPEAVFGKAGWAGCMSLPRVLSLVDGEVRYAPAEHVTSLRGKALLPGESAPASEWLLAAERGGKGMRTFDSAWLTVAAIGGDALRWNGANVLAAVDLPAAFTLRCFLDHSVLEVFLGDRAVLTHRLYGNDTARLELPAGYTLRQDRAYLIG